MWHFWLPFLPVNSEVFVQTGINHYDYTNRILPCMVWFRYLSQETLLASFTKFIVNILESTVNTLSGLHQTVLNSSFIVPYVGLSKTW